jgi:hypothetical protein
MTSENQNDKLDDMLRYRRIEPARADLAQRIILKAESMPQTLTSGLLKRRPPNPSQANCAKERAKR